MANMSFPKALGAIAATASVCGIAGATIGSIIGRFAPDAYRVLLYRQGAPEFSPVQFGVGQGLIQGLMVGVFVGVAVVVVLAWREVRIAQTNSKTD